jgi:hypothetical protein
LSLLQVRDCLSCQQEISLDRLLPHLAGVIIDVAGLAGARLCVWARARAGSARVPQVRPAIGPGSRHL